MTAPVRDVARRLRWAWAGVAWLAVAAHAAEPSAPAGAPDGDTCSTLIPVPWPTTIVERRLHLRRLESARTQCIGEPAFLAALGALWLEDGDPEQARIWLERSLMLDPDGAGAQADHALALAALGEPTALRELAAAWRIRTDVPAALRRRILAAVEPGREFRLPTVRLGGEPAGRRMSTRGDASLTVGYESNLAVSPRLTELTLTPPDEPPVVLPVISTPRRGAAVRADLAWQASWQLSQRQAVRTALGLSGRTSPGESDTDWHQLTAAVAYARQWGDWSGGAQLDAVWFGGALTEPYALLRARLVAELTHENCDQQLQLEVDGRRQSRTRTADSTTTIVSWRLRCRPFGARDWTAGLVLRGGVDRPHSDERPGGVQSSESASLNLGYRPTALSLVELNLGTVALRDRSGYSELLEYEAIRRQRQSFVTIEGSHALDLTWMPGAEAVVQASWFRQASNLALFRHRGYTVYSGLRWPW